MNLIPETHFGENVSSRFLIEPFRQTPDSDVPSQVSKDAPIIVEYFPPWRIVIAESLVEDDSGIHRKRTRLSVGSIIDAATAEKREEAVGKLVTDLQILTSTTDVNIPTEF